MSKKKDRQGPDPYAYLLDLSPLKEWTEKHTELILIMGWPDEVMANAMVAIREGPMNREKSRIRGLLYAITNEHTIEAVKKELRKYLNLFCGKDWSKTINAMESTPGSPDFNPETMDPECAPLKDESPVEPKRKPLVRRRAS